MKVLMIVCDFCATHSRMCKKHLPHISRSVSEGAFSLLFAQVVRQTQTLPLEMHLLNLMKMFVGKCAQVFSQRMYVQKHLLFEFRKAQLRCYLHRFCGRPRFCRFRCVCYNSTNCLFRSVKTMLP